MTKIKVYVANKDVSKITCMLESLKYEIELAYEVEQE